MSKIDETSQVSSGRAWTASDTQDLPRPTNGVYVGTSGDVKVTWVNGDVSVVPSLAAGVWHPMKVTRIWSTSTTAGGIHIGWTD